MRIFILLLIVLCNQALCQRCDNLGYKKNCDQSVAFPDSAPLNGTVSDAQLNQICANLSWAKSCYDKDSIDCPLLDLISYNPEYEGSNYACGPGKNGLKSMQACFTGANKALYTKTLDECLKSNDIPLSDVHTTGGYCKSLSARYDCYMNVSRLCSSQEFVADYVQKIEGRFQLFYGCKIYLTNWRNAVYPECNMPIWEKCWNMYGEFVKNDETYFMNFDYLKIFSFTPNVFNRACIAADNTSSCMKESQCASSPSFFGANLRIINATQYLCREDRKGYDMIVECYSKNARLFQSCTNTTLTVCSTYKVYTKCITDTIKNVCGNSTTIENYLYKSIQPLLNFAPNCFLQSSAIKEASKSQVIIIILLLSQFTMI